MTLYRLKKKERLSGKKRIETLFQEGKSFFYAPFRVIWRSVDEDQHGSYPARIAIAVSRKNFKKAVQRNLIKRRIREAYRRNKPLLTEWLKGKKRSLDMVFIYTGADILPYPEMEKKIIITLRKIIEENEKAVH